MGTRRVAIATLLVAAVAGAAAAAAAAAPRSASGARNAQIAGLQVALRAYGLYLGRIDAIPGPATVAATKAFQQRAGVPTTGRADVRTRVAMGPVGGPLLGRRPLRLRAFGWDVAVLQFLLAESRLSSGPITGWFDRATLLGVKRFQRSAGLDPDGVAGRATLAAIARQWQVPLAYPSVSRAVPSRPSPPAYVRYVVRPGDTLSAIAERAGTTPEFAARLNGLQLTDVLPVGRQLRLSRAPRRRRPRPRRSGASSITGRNGRASTRISSGRSPGWSQASSRRSSRRRERSA